MPTAKEDNATTTSGNTYVMIQLDVPIQRGEKSITEIQLRKPNAGELRGVTLVDVSNIDVMALQKVLPRITQPTLTPQEISNLDLADMMSIGIEVASFLAKKALRDSFPTT